MALDKTIINILNPIEVYLNLRPPKDTHAQT